jgi:DNA-binding NtrC family response regulator
MRVTAPPTIAGSSPAMESVRAAANRAARGSAKVLITGESGVGKDVIARYIHARSQRAAGPLISVSCSGLTEPLLEAELFGHAGAAAPVPSHDKIGKLQLAHTGTLFLDEVGELTIRMQAVLLRFLDSGEIPPPGAQAASARVDVRIIAATNRNLREIADAGQFRQDLFYRLRVVEIHVPPLRERIEDIRPLVAYLCAAGGRALQFTEPAWRALEAYRWPGNVRELSNVLEQIAAMTDGDSIDVEHLPLDLEAPTTRGAGPFAERRRQTADELYDGLVGGRFSFWDHVHPRFLGRDLTRHDVRELIKRGLRTTNGSYRLLLSLYGMPADDYKRLLNFLSTHQCDVDYRPFRGQPESRLSREPRLRPQPPPQESQPMPTVRALAKINPPVPR